MTTNITATHIIARLTTGGRCAFDMLNPCFDNRPSDVPGRYADGTPACDYCTAKAFLQGRFEETPQGGAEAGPVEWRVQIEKALRLAKVFDDGSDGADGESAASVVSILSDLLANMPYAPELNQKRGSGIPEDALWEVLEAAADVLFRRTAPHVWEAQVQDACRKVIMKWREKSAAAHRPEDDGWIRITQEHPEPPHGGNWLTFRPAAPADSRVTTLWFDPVHNGWSGQYEVKAYRPRPDEPRT